MRVLVPLAQGCEELEAVTIIDLLRRANIEVISAGLDAKIITASRGVVLTPDTTLDDVINEAFDMIILPGGLPGADHLNNDPRIHTLLHKMHNENKFIAAICAAPKILLQAGILKGKSATAYPGSTDDIENHHANIDTTQAIIQDGNIITSRGPGTAMDFTLALINILAGEKVRDDVEAGLART